MKQLRTPRKLARAVAFLTGVPRVKAKRYQSPHYVRPSWDVIRHKERRQHLEAQLLQSYRIKGI